MININVSKDEAQTNLHRAINNIMAVENGAERELTAEEKIHGNDKQVNDVLTYLKSKGMNIQTNANEVMHSGNTGYGAELIPGAILSTSYLDLLPQFAYLLPRLPGFHGTNLPYKKDVPIIGEDEKMQGYAERTSAAPAGQTATYKMPTATVEIEQKPFRLITDVSDWLNTYSSIQLEAILKLKLAKSAARTVDSVIINGDAETGATGNVNSDDQAPATTFATKGGAYYSDLQIDHGIRELAINNAYEVNAGTADFDDLLKLKNVLGELASDSSLLLWLFNQETYNKFLGIDEFKNQYINGLASTVNSGVIQGNILGVDAMVARDMKKTEADGKLSATPANNTLGQMALLYTPSIQYGYGKPLQIGTWEYPSEGTQLISWFHFGFVIADKQAGMSDPSVAIGRNINL